jgi:hypothetical protein
MKAMPLSGGILEKKSSNAFNPPAEAPMPTMRKFFRLLSTDGGAAVIAAEDFAQVFTDRVPCFFLALIALPALGAQSNLRGVCARDVFS